MPKQDTKQSQAAPAYNTTNAEKNINAKQCVSLIVDQTLSYAYFKIII